MGEHLKSLSELYRLWDSFNVPIDDVERIEEAWLHFPRGTPRWDIWIWFERQNPLFIVGEVMQGIRKQL